MAAHLRDRTWNGAATIYSPLLKLQLVQFLQYSQSRHGILLGRQPHQVGRKAEQKQILVVERIAVQLTEPGGCLSGIGCTGHRRTARCNQLHVAARALDQPFVIDVVVGGVVAVVVVPNLVVMLDVDRRAHPARIVEIFGVRVHFVGLVEQIVAVVLVDKVIAVVQVLVDVVQVIVDDELAANRGP